ncbi:MAG: MarR family transcriptional regulator [Alphaproteobacteria bacterium]|nr:MarR family transcriptional regulator [Alphaproteobacteria bacterium]
MAFSDQIIDALRAKDGQTDRELTDRLKSRADHPSQANQYCRRMASAGAIKRLSDPASGTIRNWIGDAPIVTQRAEPIPTSDESDGLSEDEVKAAIKTWLENDGWTVEVAWGRERGVDIIAQRGQERWLIEAKGCGSRQAMRVNYFIAMLGELLQRMDDPDARYSIALPDMKQFRGLWDRLPELAKQRVQVTALFVGPDGKVYPNPSEDI